MSISAISVSIENIPIETLAKARRIGGGDIESGIISSLFRGLSNLDARRRKGFVKPSKEATNERA